ncbi:MAG: efflux RND transporter periplasmic adaptor subunit [Deltaproteobacteria bacterium]|nr:efflux RND transporter periplasmic adaptor subunit [Deltaproteobacteria bacterium]
MSTWRRRLGPYFPAAITIGLGIVVAIVFHRPIADWLAGRPVMGGEASRTVTLDAGPLRLGASVRPAAPVPGDNILYIGVGDRLGALRPDATLVATRADGSALPVEAAGDGRFRVEVEVPEVGPVSVHLAAEAPGVGAGHVIATLEARRAGVGTDGRSADGVAFYTCPMHPSIRAPAPGTCPICAMDLVAVTHDEVVSGAVRIDARRRQLIGVTTAVLARAPMRVVVRATGIAQWDETRLRDVTARADGWVEELFADFTGKPVAEGEPLASLYVPEIRAAQLELIAAARGRRQAEGTPLEASTGQLKSAALEKLRALGVGDEDIKRVLRTGRPEPAIVISAPEGGVVAERMVGRGSPVMANQPMMRLASLDPIWVEAHIYEQDAALVHVGLEAVVTFPYLGGVEKRGLVTFIEPVIDEATRTMRVRVTLPNADGAVRPGMYADAVLEVRRPEALVVPEEAVIFAGPRRVVFVDQGGGLMRPVEVTLGARGVDGFEVVKGLSEGQRVVTSGNFLIGAESRLRSALGVW